MTTHLSHHGPDNPCPQARLTGCLHCTRPLRQDRPAPSEPTRYLGLEGTSATITPLLDGPFEAEVELDDEQHQQLAQVRSISRRRMKLHERLLDRILGLLGL